MTRHRDPKLADSSAETKPASTDRREIAHMSADARPSIAVLRQIVDHDPGDADADGMVCAACYAPFVVPPDLDPSSVCDVCAQSIVADALPALLHVAAAALKLRGPCDHPEGRCSNGSHFRGCSRFAADVELTAALDKVRP